ncbi:unnamed protein product [Caenorhabditis angaria]|uniref:Chondroitin proteoglycan 4 domain-containing protein n=1 Tax=Caenorhabditis angaria TaxID=860376 RepID=A0A9P1IZU1_9PELO|nr:unnamed protein product [Caenorhabditis angaria]
MGNTVFLSIFLLIIGIPYSFSNNYCTTVCTAKFQRGIAEITGSADTSTMLAPFHRIISTNEDNKAAHKQIRILCSKVKGWETCLRTCHQNGARQVLLSSMDQWKRFCSVMRKPNRATMEFMNCERDHQQRVSHHCRIQIPQTQIISIFCEKFHHYHKCSERQKYHCSDEAMHLKKTIDKAIEKSFNNIIKYARNRVNIPRECNMFHRPHHKPKILKGEIRSTTMASITTTKSDVAEKLLVSEVTIYDYYQTTTSPEFRVEDSSIVILDSENGENHNENNITTIAVKETQSLVNSISYPQIFTIFHLFSFIIFTFFL